MFAEATSYNQDMENWQTNEATNMTRMFKDASALKDNDLTSWEVHTVPSDGHDEFMIGVGSGNTEPRWR
jgi:hypothetical protein